MQHNIDTDIRFSIVPEWVLDAKVSDRAIRIYSILARYADNETLQAFPSRETLAKRAHCSAKAVTKAIHELVAIGAVLKQHRKHGDSYQSNLYTLRRVGPIPTLPRDSNDPTLGSDLTPPRVTDGLLTITSELEPQNIEPENDISEQFNQFWAIYPRKKGKGQARKAFEKAMLKTDLETILAGVEAYVEHEDMYDPQFIAHPTTWLNGERWDDEHEEVKVVSKSPYVGSEREWVRDMHDLGEHFECREGEFGCK
jgi:biotin operon repressor